MTSTSRIPEKILSYRSKDNGVDQYLVKFRNLGIAYSSWMTTDQIGNPAMVHKYRQSAKLDEPTQPPSSSLSSGDSSSTTTTTTTTTITSSLVAAAVAAATATVNALSFGNSPQREKKEIKESKYDVSPVQVFFLLFFKLKFIHRFTGCLTAKNREMIAILMMIHLTPRYHHLYRHH